MVNRKKEFTAVTFLWLLILLLLFLISSRLYFRLDLTRNRANTLSPFSLNLCGSLDEPLTITYFVSGRLVQAHPLPGQVGDLIEEYAAGSSGMIRFVRKDPQRLDMIREMETLGMEPRQMEIIEKNESALTYVYSGILLEYLDRMVILPSVFSLDKLEYDLSRGILSLVREQKRELGVIVGDVSKEWKNEYGRLDTELLAAGFSIRLINAWEEIPPNVNCLFVFGGAGELDEWELYRIDRFIQAGGGVLFAVNGTHVDFEHGFAVRPAADSQLLAMLDFYGASVHRSLVLDTACLELRYQVQIPNGAFELNTIRYPHWIAVSSQNGNRFHPVSSGFKGLDLYWASPLELKAPPGVEAVPLFSSSAEAWLQTKNFAAALDEFYLFEEEKEQTGGTKILGAALAGIFPQAFSSDTATESSPSRIIVIGNTGFAGALMNATLAEERNLDFLVKSALWLGGEEEFIALRKNRDETLRLDKIQDPEKKNKARNFSIFVNVAALPFLVMITGLVVARRRALGGRK